MNDISSYTSATASFPLPRTRRILIIEDNPVHRRLMENELRANYDLTFAADSQTALRYLSDKSFSFDLVVLDSLIPPRPGELPIMSEATRILDTAPRRSIVVVVSGTPTEHLKRQLAQFDVKRIFEKPFSLTEFQEYVDSLFPVSETDRAE